MEKPHVSVVIPTKNSSRTLSDCLQSLVRQEYKSFEIIVVDAHSRIILLKLRRNIQTKSFLKKAELVPRDECRNQYAHGDIIAFTDDDCEVPKDWLKQIVSNFEDETLDVLGGLAKTPEDSSKIEKAFGAVLNDLLLITYSWDDWEKVIGCNSAYRKATLIDAEDLERTC